MLLGFVDGDSQAHRLAQALLWPFKTIDVHRFPDGEIRLTLPTPLPKHVCIFLSLDDPNEKLIELLLASQTARELGVSRLSLVAPYLCYMRQDSAFHPGEAVSQRIVGRFLADLFDDIITVNPHLHRIKEVKQAIPVKQAVSLSVTSEVANYLEKNFNQPLVLGPDAESRPWIKAVAQKNSWQYGVCEKQRRGDEAIIIQLPDIDFSNREVVIVDDIASSGQTIAVAARSCLDRDASSVDVFVTHALFAPGAEHRIYQSGVRNLWSSDSVEHDSNIIHLTELLSKAIKSLN